MNLTPELIIYGLFGSLILLNLITLYAIYITAKLHQMRLLSGSLWNLIKNMQKSDPIGLRAEVKRLEPLPKEILEKMLYGGD